MFWYEDSLTDIPNLKRNISITALTICNIPSSIPKSLILALENLQSLKVNYHSTLNFKDDFKWIVKNASKLEFLMCENSYAEATRAYYQLLKTQDDSINQNINVSSWV